MTGYRIPRDRTAPDHTARDRTARDRTRPLNRILPLNRTADGRPPRPRARAGRPRTAVPVAAITVLLGVLSFAGNESAQARVAQVQPVRAAVQLSSAVQLSNAVRPSAATATASAAVPSTLGLLAIDTGQAAHLGNTSKYIYVVLQESQWSHVAAIKRANPKTKVLAYMEAAATQLQSCTNPSPPRHLSRDSYGINYCWAAKYHPSWFLTGRSGRRLAAVDYPRSMTMDVGQSWYAANWAAAAYLAAHHDGFDGIYLDDVNVDPGHGLNGRIARYTDQQYGRATTAFASRVGNGLRAHGMVAIANVGMSPWVGWQLADTLALGKHLTAVNREHYSRYGDICGPFTERFNTTATNGTPPMNIMLSYEQQLQANGTSITGIDYGHPAPSAADVATMAYGRAQFLLAWNGKAGSAYFYRKCSTVDTASPQWMVNLGLPTGPVRTTSSGALVRPYTKGLVVLNPSRSGSAPVGVASGMLLQSGRPAGSRVNLAPETAVLLSS